MRSQITMLHKRLQTTFVYVTHDQTEAMTMADRIAVMDKGVIRQFDTPQKLYAEPADMFVAGFIGSPRMNFIECEIKKKNGVLTAEFEGNNLRIPSAKAKALEVYENRAVIMGIRPEHISAYSGGMNIQEGCVITAQAEIAEMTGGEVNVYFNLAQSRCIARIRTERKINTGDAIKLLIDCNTAHFFDKETSKAIGRI